VKCCICGVILMMGVECKVGCCEYCFLMYDEVIFEWFRVWCLVVFLVVSVLVYVVFIDVMFVVFVENMLDDVVGLVCIFGIGVIKCECYGE